MGPLLPSSPANSDSVYNVHFFLAEALLRQVAFGLCPFNTETGANVAQPEVFDWENPDQCFSRYNDLRPCPRDGTLNFVPSGPMTSSPEDDVNPESKEWFTGVKNCAEASTSGEFSSDAAVVDWAIPTCGCTGVGELNTEAQEFFEAEWDAGNKAYEKRVAYVHCTLFFAVLPRTRWRENSFYHARCDACFLWKEDLTSLRLSSMTYFPFLALQRMGAG